MCLFDKIKKYLIYIFYYKMNTFIIYSSPVCACGRDLK